MTVPTYYDILQVARNAPPRDIRVAYRRMAQRYHPDKSPDNRFAPRVMANLNKAYQVLSDPEQRERHDRWIAAHETPADQALRPAGRLARPDALPVLRHTRRWPWVLLFSTICCAVAAVGTVLYKTELSPRPHVAGAVQQASR